MQKVASGLQVLIKTSCITPFAFPSLKQKMLFLSHVQVESRLSIGNVKQNKLFYPYTIPSLMKKSYF